MSTSLINFLSFSFWKLFFKLISILFLPLFKIAKETLVPSISGGYGFLSILIVLASSKRIIPTMLLALFFSAMIAGGSQLQLRLNLHSSLISIILSSAVFFWLVVNSVVFKSKLNKLLKG